MTWGLSCILIVCQIIVWIWILNRLYSRNTMYLHSGTSKFISQFHYQIPWLEEFFFAFYSVCGLQLKCDGTQWCKGGEVKGKLANEVGSQYSSHYLRKWCIQHYYHWCAHLGCQYSTELMPPRRFKWSHPFRRKTKSGFCTCAITFQVASTLTLVSFTSSEFLFTHHL
jgi:hypothetical protein